MFSLCFFDCVPYYLIHYFFLHIYGLKRFWIVSIFCQKLCHSIVGLNLILIDYTLSFILELYFCFCVDRGIGPGVLRRKPRSSIRDFLVSCCSRICSLWSSFPSILLFSCSRQYFYIWHLVVFYLVAQTTDFGVLCSIFSTWMLISKLFMLLSMLCQLNIPYIILLWLSMLVGSSSGLG